MKRIPGAAILLVGLLIVLTPWYIFPICGQGRFAPPNGEADGPHGCTNAARSATAAGVVLAGLGIMAIAFPSRRMILTGSAGSAALSAYAGFAPHLQGLCGIATMPCRMGTAPALAVLAVLGLAVGIVGVTVRRRME